MEKFSKDWLEKFQAKIGSKYKFLLMSVLENYEIIDCTCDRVLFNKKNEITSINFDVHLDFLGACNSDSKSIGKMINKINNDIMQVLHNYVVDRKTFKLSNKIDNVIVPEITFLEFKYIFDEKHEAIISFYYLYN